MVVVQACERPSGKSSWQSAADHSVAGLPRKQCWTVDVQACERSSGKALRQSGADRRPAVEAMLGWLLSKRASVRLTRPCGNQLLTIACPPCPESNAPPNVVKACKRCCGVHSARRKRRRNAKRPSVRAFRVCVHMRGNAMQTRGPWSKNAVERVDAQENKWF